MAGAGETAAGPECGEVVMWRRGGVCRGGTVSAEEALGEQGKDTSGPTPFQQAGCGAESEWDPELVRTPKFLVKVGLYVGQILQ